MVHSKVCGRGCSVGKGCTKKGEEENGHRCLIKRFVVVVVVYDVVT